jgi:hypothetical protein
MNDNDRVKEFIIKATGKPVGRPARWSYLFCSLIPMQNMSNL